MSARAIDTLGGAEAFKKLSLVVVEPSRQLQHLLRGMLTTYGVRSIRMYADTEKAANALLSEPPSAVLLDWEAGPYYGPNFLKLFRHQNMYPVCLVPIIVMLTESRRADVEKALRLGAQAVVVKPMSPVGLMKRISWAISSPKLKLKGEHYVVEGVESRLAEEREREGQLRTAREFQASQFAEMDTIQNDVDRILGSAF